MELSKVNDSTFKLTAERPDTRTKTDNKMMETKYGEYEQAASSNQVQIHVPYAGFS